MVVKNGLSAASERAVWFSGRRRATLPGVAPPPAVEVALELEQAPTMATIATMAIANFLVFNFLISSVCFWDAACGLGPAGLGRMPRRSNGDSSVAPRRLGLTSPPCPLCPGHLLFDVVMRVEDASYRDRPVPLPANGTIVGSCRVGASASSAAPSRSVLAPRRPVVSSTMARGAGIARESSSRKTASLTYGRIRAYSPPRDTRVGLNTFTRPARPMPSQRPDSATAARATLSPRSAAEKRSARALVPPNGSRPDRRSNASSPTSASQQPRAPQWQSAPFGSTVRWPTSPAYPAAPASDLPPTTKPAPMPPSPHRQMKSLEPRPDPRKCSAEAARSASVT